MSEAQTKTWRLGGAAGYSIHAVGTETRGKRAYTHVELRKDGESDVLCRVPLTGNRLDIADQIRGYLLTTLHTSSLWPVTAVYKRHIPMQEAKTVPMNLVVMPNEAHEHPTYDWQPRGGAYFSGPMIAAFALILFVGGAAIGLLGFAAVKANAPALVQGLCDERAAVCQ